mgnify:CR=1 FL=1
MIKKRELRIKEIESKLGEIIDNLFIVENNLPQSFADFSKIGLIKDGIYKKIEHALENLIDICSIINSDLRLGSPETEDSIFEHLEDKDIFSKRAIELIRNMKKFRNVLVHKYGDIDDKKAYEDIKEGLPDLDIVIKEIEKFLEKHKDKKKKWLIEKDRDYFCFL